MSEYECKVLNKSQGKLTKDKAEKFTQQECCIFQLNSFKFFILTVLTQLIQKSITEQYGSKYNFNKFYNISLIVSIDEEG
jgi:hypothetical protein